MYGHVRNQFTEVHGERRRGSSSMRGWESCSHEVMGRRRGWLTPMPHMAVPCVGFRESPTAGMAMAVAGQRLRSARSICSRSRVRAKPTRWAAGTATASAGRREGPLSPQPRFRGARDSFAHNPMARGASFGFPAPEQQMRL